MIPPDHGSADRSRLAAMLSLLDDPDPTVQREVEHALVEAGPAVAEALRSIAGGGESPAALHATTALEMIAISGFRSALTAVLASDSPDILEPGALALCRLRTPDLDSGRVTAVLDDLARRLDRHVHEAENGYGAMQVMNRFLIETEKFAPCGPERERYYDPDNSYLHIILERRAAIPVGLGVVWLLVAQRLGLPLRGVNFPSHFLLLYESAHQHFYVDPFNKGQFLSDRECRATLRSLGMEERPEYLGAAADTTVLARMMRNLVPIYNAPRPRLADALRWGIEKVEGR